jgi:hypothetical protein
MVGKMLTGTDALTHPDAFSYVVSENFSEVILKSASEWIRCVRRPLKIQKNFIGSKKCVSEFFNRRPAKSPSRSRILTEGNALEKRYRFYRDCCGMTGTANGVSKEGGNQMVPYASATSDMRAREEIKKILTRFGCESIGFMDDMKEHEVLLAFTHRGRQVQMRASAKGWAQMWLKENPWTKYHRRTRHEYEQEALKRGHVAVNSVLRDWIKGQVTAIEIGVLSFEAVFMPHMLTATGQTVLERIKETNLLPAPEAPKIVQLPTG